MNFNYINNIKIDNYRNIKNINIDIPSNKVKNIIFTGKNGSGKTSLLNLLYKKLSTAKKNLPIYIDISNSNDNIYDTTKNILLNIKAKRDFNFTNNDDSISNFLRKVIIGYLNALENNNLNTSAIQLKSKFEQVLTYLLDLNTKSENDNLTDFENNQCEFKINEKLEIIISINGNSKKLNQLPHGYLSILKIITGILEKHFNLSYDKSNTFNLENGFGSIQGIVLIDEIENHLHAQLQKKIIPLLDNFFPNIQFVFTTHSPIVLSSTENILVYDISSGEYYEDLIEYSLNEILIDYLGVEIKTYILWEKYDRLKTIVNKCQNDKEFINIYSDEIYNLISKMNELKESISYMPKFINKINNKISDANEILKMSDDNVQN